MQRAFGNYQGNWSKELYTIICETSIFIMATKTKADFKKENIRLGTVKATYSRTHKHLEEKYEELEALVKMKDENPQLWSEATAKITSESIQKYRIQAESALTKMDRGAEALIDVILLLSDADTTEGVDVMTERVSTDISSYYDKYGELNSRYANVLRMANDMNYQTANQKSTSKPAGPIETTDYVRFQSCPELKPTFLNQDSDMVDINVFCKQFRDYMNMGYKGKPPTTGISMHLSPFVHSSWMQALQSNKMEERDLEEIVSLIQEEGKLRTPVHQRRLQLFKARRQQSRHTEYIFMLEKLMSVADFDNMTADQLLIHIFADTADATMSRIALDILATENPKVADLRVKVTETEGSIWYQSGPKAAKAAFLNTGKQCATCDGRSHTTENCWGQCIHCKGYGHLAEKCRKNPGNKVNEEDVQKGTAAAVIIPKKKKKKKKGTGKTALTNVVTVEDKPEEIAEVSEASEEEEEVSEEDSPVKPTSQRASRVGFARKCVFKNCENKGSLNQMLSSIAEEDLKEWSDDVFRALKARKDRNPDNPTVYGTMWTKRSGGRSTEVAAIMDSGCTHPLTTLTVTQALKMEMTPLDRELDIVEASGNLLRILGTVSFYLECEMLGGRKLVEAAVIEGEGAAEILISLALMKKWDLIHDTFPMETISDYLTRKTNKVKYAYSSLYSFNTDIYNKSVKIKEPSKICNDLKLEIVKSWSDCFKETLGPNDRMSVDPVKLRMKDESKKKPSFCVRPFDTPYHLRDAYEKELNNCLSAGQLVPCGTETTAWSSKAFPVLKGDGKSVRIVSDFKELNQNIERPVWPTESSGQLLRHIDPEARVFVGMDMTSGYHQIRVDEESSNLLAISTPMGRYKFTVLAQGVCSSSDIFNYLTDGDCRRDNSGALKNMDDILLHAKTIPELKIKLENFLTFCRAKNLKLKPSKLNISEEVEFGGTLISSKLVKKEQVVCILPKDKRIEAFFNLKKPKNKKDIQSFCGMLSSLQAWNPSLPMAIPMLRKAAGGSSKVTWNSELEMEYNRVMEIMQHQIKLSPYNPKKKLRLVIDGASSIGTGFMLVQFRDDERPELGCNIIQAGSGLLPEGRDFSPIEAEAISLDRAISSTHHWIYYCEEVELVSDCQGLLGMFNKQLADITNRKLQKIMEKAQNYSWKLTHIKGESNKIADALSRLCTQICLYSHKYENIKPRLLNLSKRATVRQKQLEHDDPLVMNIANEGNIDLEYLSMLNQIENKIEIANLPADGELRQMGKGINSLAIVEMENGTRLIVRDETEILIPKSMRQEMVRVLHMTHQADTAMIQQARNCIFWPGMKSDLLKIYQECSACQENKVSKANEHNEVSQDNLFENFLPGQQVEIDFAQKGCHDYLMIVCSLTGYIQAYKTNNKGTDEAVKCLRNWSTHYGMPYIVKSDGGPAFRDAWETELKKRGVKIAHSSCYNPQSMGLVERSVQTLKGILNKEGNNLSQLQIAELVFAINSREQQDQGSAITRFLGRGVRGNLPNSLDRSSNWEENVEVRGQKRQARVDKKGRTVGKKQSFEIGEAVKLQDLKTKKWTNGGEITNIRTTPDGTIASYEILTDNGTLTTRHRRYIQKVHKQVKVSITPNSGQLSQEC